MQENNDKLIRDFLQAGKQDIPDKGFSDRVMQQLPAKESLTGKYWTWSCFALTAGLFILLDGFGLLYAALKETFNTLIEQEAVSQLDIRSLLIAGIVLLCLIYKKIASLA